MFTSVSADPKGSIEDARWSWGMAMNLKDKLLFILVLVVVAASFLFSHYWTCTLFVIQRAVATGVLPLIIPKSFVGVNVICFLL